MSIQYQDFKASFIKTAVMQGYDEPFLEAFLKVAEEHYSYWDTLVSQAAASSGDPDFYKKAYDEYSVVILHQYPLTKQAEGNFGGADILGMLKNFGSSAGNMFGQQGMGEGLGGALAGGGGGMMIGLLLSQLFNIPLPAAMLLGTLGGGMLGYGAAGTPQGQEKVFGVKPPVPGANAAAAAMALPTAENAGEGNPAAAAQHNENQVASNNVGIPSSSQSYKPAPNGPQSAAQPPQPSKPLLQPIQRNPVPGPGAAQPPGTPPVVPPPAGGAPAAQTPFPPKK